MSDILTHWSHSSSPPRDSQIKALEWLEKQTARYLILEAPVGCHAKGAPILMYDGTLKNVEDIEPNDLLMGVNSTSRTVKKLYRGQDLMYKIIPKKGESFVVNQHHILSLKRTPIGKKAPNITGNTTVNISVKEYVSKSKNFKRNHLLYRSTGIDFPTNNQLEIDPYFLGIYLGDGTSTQGSVRVSSADEEIIEYLTSYASIHNINATVTSKKNTPAKDIHLTERAASFGFGNPSRLKNYFVETLKLLGLHRKKTLEKFIPQKYKTASKQERLNLLAGLLDSDGHLYHNTGFEIISKSKTLADDIVFLAQSLGFAAYIKPKISRIKNLNFSGSYYRITISGNTISIPTKLKRKQARSRKLKNRVNVTNFSCVEMGIDDYYGFELDGDHLYHLKDFTVVHNSGKSHIGVTYANSVYSPDRKKSFILTPQKILQQQYQDSFPPTNVFCFYGKGNYSCAKLKSTCDVGSLIKPQCETCPYRGAKEVAKMTPHVVLNYKLALLSFRYAQTFKPRPLMVLDECHNTEAELCELDAIEITEFRCKKYKIPFQMCKNIAEALAFINDIYLPKMVEVATELAEKTEPMRSGTLGRDLTSSDLTLIKEFNGVAEHLEAIQGIAEGEPEELRKDFALVYDKQTIKFKRLFASFSFHHVLEPMADRFLFMSSTILNHKGFCQDLGLKYEDSAFLSMDSEFPHENRPVIFIPTMKMNKDWSMPENEKGRFRMIAAMSNVLEGHKNDSGIVHTSSFAIAKWMTDELSTITSHKIMHHNPESGVKREKVIEEFRKAKEPCILFSPSITEGLDLMGDIARFAVFAKIPYPFLGDQWVFTRKLISDEWYARQALIEVIQGGGRIVRSKTDWGFVYILDSSWNFLLSKTRHTIPEWWMEAYNEMA